MVVACLGVGVWSCVEPELSGFMRMVKQGKRKVRSHDHELWQLATVSLDFIIAIYYICVCALGLCWDLLEKGT